MTIEPAFKDRVAIVTGAAGGMGRAIAAEFLNGGAFMVLVDLNHERLEDTVRDLGGPGDRFTAITADLTSGEAPDRVVSTALDVFGSADILVNNAGIARFRRFEQYSADDWDEVFAINLRAPFLLSQAFGRNLIERGLSGVIVNIGSIGGRTANPQNIPYGVSKTGINGLSQQLAVEWGPHGIRVNVVNPGLTSWHMEALEPDWDVKRQQAELVPLRQLVEPADVAAAVGFLASDAARCITGAVLDIDGGYLLSLLSQLPRPERFAGN